MGGISRRTLDVRLVRNCAPDELDHHALNRRYEREGGHRAVSLFWMGG